MTPQEILKYNKRCAEFLGYKCSVNEQYELPNMMTFPPKENSNLCHTAKVCCVEDMIFHSDWNWIMEVVEAIENLPNVVTYHFGVEIDICSHCIRIYIVGDKKICDTAPKINVYTKDIGRKGAVVQAINQFLIWYNENNKTS